MRAVELRDALRTTGAVREFTDEPVTAAQLHEVLELARFAPSGGNRQCWRVVVAEDPAVRRTLRDCYLEGWYEYVALGAAGMVPFAVTNDRDAERRALDAVGRIAAAAAEAPGGFPEHLDEVPALLVVVADLRRVAAMDRDVAGYTFVGGASVYPFVWNLLLAAHELGLGGVMTTMVRRHDARAREALRLEDHHEIAAVVALGWPVTRPSRLTRAKVADFTTRDTVDGEPFGTSSGLL